MQNRRKAKTGARIVCKCKLVREQNSGVQGNNCNMISSTALPFPTPIPGSQTGLIVASHSVICKRTQAGKMMGPRFGKTEHRQ